MISFLGLLGGIAFGIGFVPQIIKAYKTKSTTDISWIMILLSYIGNICMLGYVILDGKCTIVFLCDYLGSLGLTITLSILKFTYDKRS